MPHTTHEPYQPPAVAALSSEERAIHADYEQAINAALAAPVDPATDAHCGRHGSTAETLARMAAWARSLDDHDGAALLERYAREMARHEATIA